MHMKLLDEETLLIGEYPEGTSDGPQIEANIQYVLSNFNTKLQSIYILLQMSIDVYILTNNVIHKDLILTSVWSFRGWLSLMCTVCPRSMSHFYKGTRYIKVDKASWTHSRLRFGRFLVV